MNSVIRKCKWREADAFQVTKPTSWRGGAQIFARVDDDAAYEARSKVKYNEWKKHWQVGEESARGT